MLPSEITGLHQWVCADKNKKPINPRNGKLASPTDKRTWGTYEQAVSFRDNSRGFLPHIGFVLCKEDPYCIIDLDTPEDAEQEKRHGKIIQAFDSYIEVSQSGKGVHIITKAETPKGFRKDNVEVYSSERYMIMTGNPLGKVKPVTNQQALINTLVLEMDKIHRSKVVFIDTSGVDIFAVEDLHNEILSNQYVASEYELLCNGDWQNRLNYQSQSDADFNMAMIICEHTQDDELAKSLFCMSKMFREEKPKPYLDYTFSRARDKTPLPQEPIDFDALKEQMQQEQPQPQANAEVVPEQTYPVEQTPAGCDYPSGLIGEVAEYIYSSAPRPVRQIALAGAVTMLAGICGRAYHINGSGLNQYMAVLASTGTGKDAVNSGTSMLYNAVAKEVPSIRDFSGPDGFSSGQALIKHIADQPCFSSIFGEFGLLFQTMSGNQSGDHMIMYRQVLLKLYTKSGPHGTVNPTMYAKKEDSTEMVQSPSVTILGETTPETFYSHLSESLISEGLIPRFHIMEYTGIRVPPNKSAFHYPSAALVKKLCALVTTINHMINNGSNCEVKLDEAAQGIIDGYGLHADRLMNSGNEVTKQLWNRAQLKAYRFAGLVAATINIHNPTVTAEIAKWAINFTTAGINLIMKRFEAGEVGQGEELYESEVRKTFDSYFKTTDKTKVNSYKVSQKLIGEPVVPYTFLRRKLKQRAAFKDHRLGAANAIKQALQDLCDAEIIKEVDRKQVQQKYGVTSPIYVKGSSW